MDKPAAQDLFLEQDKAPETLAFVESRNKASDQTLSTPHMAENARAIQAMMEREDRLIIPTRRGDWFFDFHRTAANPLGLWRRLPADHAPSPDAPWETIFDVDAFCEREGKRWIFGGAITCPWQPTRVLLRLSDGGSDLTRLLEFDTETKNIVAGGFDTPAVRAHASWLGQDEICYFGSIDEESATQSGWPRVGRRLKRGMTPAEGAPLYSAAKSDVTGYAFIMTAELNPAGETEARPINVFVANHEIGKASIHIGPSASALTRLPLPVDMDFDINRNFLLWRAKSGEQVPTGTLVLQRVRPFDEQPFSDAPRILFQPKPGVAVSQFALLREWAVYIIQDRLKPSLYILDLTSPQAEPISMELPEGIEAISFSSVHSDLHLGTDQLWVTGRGFLTPPTCYELDLSDRTTPPSLRNGRASPAYFDASGMKSILLEAVSEDGTEVPYHLVLPKSWVEGELPVLMYGYGGFSAPLSPGYSGVTGLWLEQGGAYVQAYIRGGSELGPDWHTVAKRDGRHKAYEDFVAIARDLVKRGYTKRERIACTGGSNGGLLTGVMLTRYPQDFGAVWCRVPVLDMMRFHEFPAGKAWMDEYGNPDEPEDRRFLLNYSPLHNVKPAADISYPPVYIESSSNDDRVHPSHARRFAKRLEEAGHKPLFHEYGSGGHGGAGNSAEMAKRTAMGYSFLKQTIMKD